MTIYNNAGTLESLPNDMLGEIFARVDLKDRQSVARVCKLFKEIIDTPGYQNLFVQKFAFGKDKWEKHFGKVGIEPSLPQDIYKTLMSPCPFNPRKRVGQEQFLMLMPETMNGNPFTLQTFIEDISTSEGIMCSSSDAGFTHILSEHGNTPTGRSSWFLITKDVVPGTRTIPHTDKLSLVEKLSKEANVSYNVPKLLQIVATIIMVYYQSQHKTVIYPSHPNFTYTICQEKTSVIPGAPLVVGGFAKGYNKFTMGYSEALSGLPGRLGNREGAAACREFPDPNVVLPVQNEKNKTSVPVAQTVNRSSSNKISTFASKMRKLLG